MKFQKGHDPRRNLSGRPTNAIVKPEKKSNSAAQYLFERQKYRVHEDMQTFRYAWDDYENIYQYRREFLHRIYRQIIVDPHLKSQWETRKMKTIEREFKVMRNGEEVEELSQVLKKKWFYDLMHHALDSKLWGFSLIEFGPVRDRAFQDYIGTNKKLYPAINVVDRDYVKPEWAIIVKEMGLTEGLSFFDPSVRDQLLFVGETHSAGLLFHMVKYILFKDNCLANWSEWAEIFGMDLRIAKTTAEGSDRQRLLQQLKQIGSAGYGILDLDDVFEFHGTSRQDAFKVYEELIKYIDTQVSKLIFGQDVVTNNTGRVIGQTGENIANMYGNADGKFVRSVINDMAFPKFTALGVADFTGCTFEWDIEEKLTLKERADIDLEISQMNTGSKIDPEYIEETYGTRLIESLETDEDTIKTAEKLKNLYE